MSKILDTNKEGVSQLIQSPNTWAIDLWRKGCANHWMPQEVDMSTDIKQWKNNGFITEDEKLLVKRTLGLFAMGESMVSNSIDTVEYRYITDGACRQYLLRKNFEESLHNWTVAVCCEAYNLNVDEVAEAYKNIRTIKNKNKFVRNRLSKFSPDFKIDSKEGKQSFLKNMVTFEWGNSFSSSKKVFDILKVRFGNTIILMGTGLGLTLVIGTGLGMVMAWRVDRPSGTVGTLSAIFIQSTPPFVIALLLLMVLSYRIDLFPTGGMHTPGITSGNGLVSLLSLDFLYHLILPTITMIIYYLATLLLIIRNKMLDVIDSDFVLMARAKGLAPHLVIFKHAARNAITAVAALSSPMIGFAVSAQLTVEQAFNWPGLGKLLVQSAASDDYPVLQATFLALTVLVVFLNFVLDISSRYFSHRIRFYRRL